MSGKIKVGWEVKKLGLLSQKEVLDFVLFLKNRISTQSDTDYLTNNVDSKQAIIDGLPPPRWLNAQSH